VHTVTSKIKPGTVIIRFTNYFTEIITVLNVKNERCVAHILDIYQNGHLEEEVLSNISCPGLNYDVENENNVTLTNDD
jgi:hypothetical protein